MNKNDRFKWKQQLCCLLIAVCCIFLFYIQLSKAKNTDQMIRIQCTHDQTTFQPIFIRANNEIDSENPDLFIDKEGYVSPTLWKYLSPRLTNGDEVMDMDVSEKRILLYLSRNGKNYLRIAQWDAKLNDYILIDTDFLPAINELDTYHDGNAVMLFVSATDMLMVEESEQPEEKGIFLTFQQVKNDWYLTNFTDGQSFIATLCDDVYLFNGYYESNPESIWKTHDLLPFSKFSITNLLLCLNEYYEATSSLIEY